MIDGGQVLKYHSGVSRGTLENVKPKLRAELDRRRVASAQLIKLNREKMIEDVIQRYQGWASSVPPGGSRAIDRGDVKDGIRKSLASLPFTERRVHIDQAHKFIANLNDIIAKDAGAIAGRWVSHWRRRGYNYREDHKERDGIIYVIRNNWASQKSLVQKGGEPYTDEIEMPGEFVYCSCGYSYIYSLQDMPSEYLTSKGSAGLTAARMKIFS